MRALRRWWTEMAFRFEAMSGLPPNRRSGLVVAGLAVVIVAFCAFSVFWFGQPAVQSAYVNRGFGPDWQCENISKAQVCRRVPSPLHSQ